MDSVTFSQAELLDIREQYVTRIEKLERQNEELELLLRRALGQVRAVEEIMGRAAADTHAFEELLDKVVGECDILAEEELPRPKRHVAMPHMLPKVIVSDLPQTVTNATPMRAPRSVFTAETAAGSLSSAEFEVRRTPSDQEVSDDMVVEDNGLTIIAATVPMPQPQSQFPAPMPVASRNPFQALVTRAQKTAPARRRVS